MQEARKTYTLIWWNVWVLLAMPAVWLAWSMVLFLTAILSIVWHIAPFPAPTPSDSGDARHSGGTLAARVAVTCVFGLGVVYFVLIVVTLRRYSGRTHVRAATTDWDGRAVVGNDTPTRGRARALAGRGPERGRGHEGSGQATRRSVERDVSGEGMRDTKTRTGNELRGLGLSALEKCGGGAGSVGDGALDVVPGA
jgi:hypothetical protein